MNSFSEKQPHIGIDFGTTKTLVAEYDPVKMMAKPHKLGRGSFEMPTSIYATENGDLLFGDEADDDGITDLPNLIRRFKMKLGKPGMAHVGRKAGTAVDLTTEYLANVKKQLETQVLHTSVERVILTVPAMFGPAQRKDLTTAAKQAGFKEVELLAEPVAAGIAYCDHHSDLSKQLRFIVVDWGGGTFDVAHVERHASGELRIHEDFVVGLDDIGGEVFDDELWTVASSALDAAGHGSLDRQPRAEWGKFRRDLSRAKERLSSQDSVNMTFALEGGQSCKISLKREDFNNIIRPMVQRAASFVSQLLARANNAGHPPEFILLAGGTSRIPMIREELEKITGVECRQWSEGREAIGLGASIKAHQKWGLQASLPRDDKEAAMTQYRGLLEAAWLDKKITPVECEFLEKKRTDLGLTYEESRSLQIQVLGFLIQDVVCGTKVANDPSYMNSLGMKFVSVKITGGPRNRQQVWFSIWMTRVQDYRKYAEAKSGVDGKWKNPGFAQGGDHPVVNVSWEDAVAFCEWLTQQERSAGRIAATAKYRLPTDHEWSCAAGIGAREAAEASPMSKDDKLGDVYPWDTQWPPPKGVGNYAASLKVDEFEYTSPVGSFPANSSGLYDLGGNAWEWCEDLYDATSNLVRVVRGGSWFNDRRVFLRSACRGCNDPRSRFDRNGFRVVLVGGG